MRDPDHPDTLDPPAGETHLHLEGDNYAYVHEFAEAHGLGFRRAMRMLFPTFLVTNAEGIGIREFVLLHGVVETPERRAKPSLLTADLEELRNT